MNKMEVISDALKEMMEFCAEDEIFQTKNGRGLPSRVRPFFQAILAVTMAMDCSRITTWHIV